MRSLSDKSRGRSVRAKGNEKGHPCRAAPYLLLAVDLLQAADSMAYRRRGSPRVGIAITGVQSARNARMYRLTSLDLPLQYTTSLPARREALATASR